MNKKHAKQLAELLNERNELVVNYDANKILTDEEKYEYICQKNKVIACVEIKKVQWYQWELRHLTVSESHEGQGFAKKLLKLAEKRAIDGRARIIQCTIRENNKGSKGLFQRNQYIHVSTFSNEVNGNNVEVWQKIVCPAKSE